MVMTGIVFTILCILAVAVPLALLILALLSILSSDMLTGAWKLIWIVVCFCFPIIGPIVWFIAGKNMALS
ncbi:PLDc N-terminal domain-containing protein [Cutibacterium avidum]|uniref:PLDc N-terminal domain-containing protein n=1 Tax=Cutibacterium avidum TaxID=33010 RepID=A0AB35XIJ5_9ACTN|nr:PLDc N-terminal domain-containing protein [Cutibacterium avidum]MBS6331935.1 PLDc N-terminal domain-containing protein [Propionibacterium sp.]MCO6673903.1 PLDc N-terminal domain-containing protein [Cutibacterium avidum]MCO6676416.1 PLDc N-terminal domain-containing protein [Cutibacterium avidum]MDU5968728.1 PLDc N-terminal domain-containing protein [Cutibacterium avidum]